MEALRGILSGDLDLTKTLHCFDRIDRIQQDWMKGNPSNPVHPVKDFLCGSRRSDLPAKHPEWCVVTADGKPAGDHKWPGW